MNTQKIKFNPDNKKELTYAESLGPAMVITDPENAKEYFRDMIAWMVAQGQTEEKAIEISKQNLGYYAGYYSRKTRLRVERLFMCVHPIFGAASNGFPTNKEAFDKGKQLAK